MLARPPEPSQHCPRKALTHQRNPLCRRAETRNAPAARPGLMCIPRQACAPRRCPVLLRTRGAARSAQHPAEHPVQNIALHHQLTIPGPARQPSFCSALVAFPAHNSRRSSPGFPKRLGPVPTLRLPPQRPGPHPRRPRRLAKFHFCPASCPPALPHRGLVGATKLFASVSVGSNVSRWSGPCEWLFWAWASTSTWPVEEGNHRRRSRGPRARFRQRTQAAPSLMEGHFEQLARASVRKKDDRGEQFVISLDGRKRDR